MLLTEVAAVAVAAVAAAVAAGFYAALAAKSLATGPDIAEMAAFRTFRARATLSYTR